MTVSIKIEYTFNSIKRALINFQKLQQDEHIER